jgi:probable F420-dependent oxidoreductase
LKFGLFGINNGIYADPDLAARVARQAEAAGLESVWTGEHVVLPDPQVPPSPAPPQFAMLHPPAALSFLAAVTTRLKLGTGITLIAQRNPVVLAKEMASLDVLSKGRLILGIGAGYLEPEFRALGIPFAERGARTDESVAAMQALWTQPKPAFTGRFWKFSGIDAQPRPVQPGGPPIVVGGASDSALARAARIGQGWYGFAMDVDVAGAAIDRLRKALEKAERTTGIEISITPPGRVTAELVARYAALGVHRLIALLPQQDENAARATIEGLARLV